MPFTKRLKRLPPPQQVSVAGWQHWHYWDGERWSSPLRGSATEPVKRRFFNLIGYFECEIRIGRFTRRLRLGQRLLKPLPDSLKDRAAKGRAVLEFEAGDTKKLDEKSFQNGCSGMHVVEKIGVGGDHEITPEMMLAADEQCRRREKGEDRNRYSSPGGPLNLAESR